MLSFLQKYREKQGDKLKSEAIMFFDKINWKLNCIINKLIQ
jgi:hypothetical protein